MVQRVSRWLEVKVHFPPTSRRILEFAWTSSCKPIWTYSKPRWQLKVLQIFTFFWNMHDSCFFFITLYDQCLPALVRHCDWGWIKYTVRVWKPNTIGQVKIRKEIRRRMRSHFGLGITFFSAVKKASRVHSKKIPWISWTKLEQFITVISVLK